MEYVMCNSLTVVWQSQGGYLFPGFAYIEMHPIECNSTCAKANKTPVTHHRTSRFVSQTLTKYFLAPYTIIR